MLFWRDIQVKCGPYPAGGLKALPLLCTMAQWNNCQAHTCDAQLSHAFVHADKHIFIKSFAAAQTGQEQIWCVPNMARIWIRDVVSCTSRNALTWRISVMTF